MSAADDAQDPCAAITCCVLMTTWLYFHHHIRSPLSGTRLARRLWLTNFAILVQFDGVRKRPTFVMFTIRTIKTVCCGVLFKFAEIKFPFFEDIPLCCDKHFVVITFHCHYVCVKNPRLEDHVGEWLICLAINLHHDDYLIISSTQKCSFLFSIKRPVTFSGPFVVNGVGFVWNFNDRVFRLHLQFLKRRCLYYNFWIW